MTTITETGYNWLLEKAAKWNLTVTAVRVMKPADDGSFRPMYEVEITGEAPVIPGHEFVGTVEHLSEGGNLLNAVPGKTLPRCYATATPLCQHCGTTRRRHETFILKNEHGFVQVGRNCLAEYLRDPDAGQDLLAWAGMIHELIGKLREFEHGSGGEPYFPLDDVVRLSIAYSAQFGWVSAKRAEETGDEPSVNLIRAYLLKWKLRQDEAEKMKQVAQVADTDAVREQARHVADYVAGVLGTKPDDQITNYESNLVVLFRQGFITSRHLALTCSAHYGYARRQEERSQVTGEHVGEVKVRGEFRVRVLEIRAMGAGDYGERFLVRMEDEKGNLLIWWTGESCKLEENRADFVWIKATVTEHGEYRGRKQTVVSRAALIDGPTPPKVKRPRKAKT